jgi:hypothetical protein
VKWTRIGRESVAGKAKDVQNRAVGVMYEARKSVRSEADQVTDPMASSTRGQTNGNGTPIESGYDQPVPSEIV